MVKPEAGTKKRLKVSEFFHSLRPSGFLITLLLVFLMVGASPVAVAQIDSTPQESIARYGSPVRNELPSKGLLYFQSQGLCTICHYFHGRCDMISMFSEKSEMGVPEGLSDDRIAQLLESEGNGAKSKWEMDRFTINLHWNSKDGKKFAIYDTMRHKLVIMTKAAFLRETRSDKKRP